MNSSASGNIRKVDNAYYAFVPSLGSQGEILPQDNVRVQSPQVSFNELWMVFERYKNTSNEDCDHEKHFQVCSLWNSTYDVNLRWENSYQNISGSRHLTHPVSYPPIDPPGAVMEMSRHAFSAFFWVLAVQVVGSFSWFEKILGNEKRYFGQIRSTSLLGSPDLAVYFNYNEDNTACQTPYTKLSPQRHQDVMRPGNKTIGKHNPYGLWIPHALACIFTAITVALGTVTIVKHSVMPRKNFQDILSAADTKVIRIAREPPSKWWPIKAEIVKDPGRPRDLGLYLVPKYQR
ncbi:hypothetical protein VTH82DRAFT_3951, partial [Thermothelomyces myriococcoides]